METYIAKLTRQQIEEKLLQEGSKQEFTYTELEELKNNGKLIPGQIYVLTDYEASVKNIIDDVKVQGVNNIQYKIHLTAITSSQFDEHAFATFDINDKSYKIEIWYCFENDDERFTNYLNHEDVFRTEYYWENNNLICTDIASQYYPISTASQFLYYIRANSTQSTVNLTVNGNNIYTNIGGKLYLAFSITDTQKILEAKKSKGFIYRMIDVRQNDVYFDWYNIVFYCDKLFITNSEYNFKCYLFGQIQDIENGTVDLDYLIDANGSQENIVKFTTYYKHDNANYFKPIIITNCNNSVFQDCTGWFYNVNKSNLKIIINFDKANKILHQIHNLYNSNISNCTYLSLNYTQAINEIRAEYTINCNNVENLILILNAVEYYHTISINILPGNYSSEIRKDYDINDNVSINVFGYEYTDVSNNFEQYYNFDACAYISNDETCFRLFNPVDGNVLFESALVQIW